MTFKEDGEQVFKVSIDPRTLDKILRQIGILFEYQAHETGFMIHDHDEHTLHANARNVLKKDPSRYIAAARLTQDLPAVHRVLHSDMLETLVRRLGIGFPVISTKASVHIMADDLAIVGGYHRSPPHQDWRSIQGSLDNVVLWIPLTPVRGNGLEVIRGSHKHGLLPTKEHIMTPEVIDPERLGPWEAIDCDPGDVVAFSSFLVHRTAAGPGLRIAISTRFNNAAEPTFVQRGFPSNYRTTYGLDVAWEPPKP